MRRRSNVNCDPSSCLVDRTAESNDVEVLEHRGGQTTKFLGHLRELCGRPRLPAASEALTECSEMIADLLIYVDAEVKVTSESMVSYSIR
jgi:hypothetical protein